MVPHVTCVTLCPQDLFLGIIRILMLSCYFQEKQRSFTSGDVWVLPRWQVTHFQFLSVFQDGGHVKFPTLGQRLKINVKIPAQGKARSVNFPWVTRQGVKVTVKGAIPSRNVFIILTVIFWTGSTAFTRRAEGTFSLCELACEK